MQAPATSALPRSRSFNNHRSARIPEASTYSHYSDANYVEQLDREADRLLKTPYSLPPDFAEEIRHSFDGSPDLGLQRPTISWMRADQDPSESHELREITKPLAYSNSIPVHHEKPTTNAPQHLMWTPSVLYRLPLTALVAFFVATLAALEVLHHFSSKNNGLQEADPKDYYLWTYGPTGGKVKILPLTSLDY